ncbi:MAG: hypothetical protein LBB60_10550 [Desulfovibrio sp.]|jgi:multidrug resistance efflux pump|nr:hypothetical protein [Desulfovibrio sp.]
MGGGGGKGGGQSDNSAALYQQQQADLARQKAELAAEEKAKAQAEADRRDELRRQMLGSRDVLAEDEDAMIAVNTLG